MWGYWQPAYRPTPLPAMIEVPLGYQYEGVAELLGVAQPTYAVQPGHPVQVTLYWRALQASETDLLVYVHSMGTETIRRDSYPATGNLLRWEAGQTWQETHYIYVPAGTPAQVAFPLVAGLYDAEAARTLSATNPQGEPVQPVIGRLAIQGTPHPDPPYRYRVGEAIGLQPPQLTRQGETLQLCLRWVARQAVDRDYQVFVHLYTSGAQPAVQGDHAPPYPTSAWLPGEVVPYCLTLPAVAAPARVLLGVYSLEDGQRLPVCDGANCHDHLALAVPF
ncbi:MAG: hypothetical protein HC915_19960 [Anaerolineae bacterium]|nr:hypothetical protein [Anaerolineae bacterium]